MRKVLVALVLISWLCGSVCAQEEQASGQTIVRDPFWPVDYVPEDESAPEEDVPVEEVVEEEEEPSPLYFNEFPKELQDRIRKKTSVGGIMKSRDGYFAIINAQVVRPQDVLTVDLDRQEYRFLVRSITTERVSLNYIKKEEEMEQREEQE